MTAAPHCCITRVGAELSRDTSALASATDDDDCSPDTRNFVSNMWRRCGVCRSLSPPAHGEWGGRRAELYNRLRRKLRWERPLHHNLFHEIIWSTTRSVSLEEHISKQALLHHNTWYNPEITSLALRYNPQQTSRGCHIALRRRVVSLCSQGTGWGAVTHHSCTESVNFMARICS